MSFQLQRGPHLLMALACNPDSEMQIATERFPSAPALPLSIPRRCPCMSDIAQSSFRQPPDHLQNPVGDALQFGVDLGQVARRLEDVEMPVKRNLVADFRFL